MKKRKTYEVSVINKTYSKTYSDETKFYTSDTALELNFQLKEVEYDFDSAEIILLNVDDRSLVTRPVAKSAEGFTYELEDDIVAHYGEWKGQLKFNEGGEIYVSSPVVFRIENDLSNDRPPQLTEVNTWKNLRAIADGLIADIRSELELVAVKVSEIEAAESERQSAELIRIENENQRNLTSVEEFVKLQNAIGGRNLTRGNTDVIRTAISGDNRAVMLVDFGVRNFKANTDYTISIDLKVQAGIKAFNYNHLWAIAPDTLGNVNIGSIDVIDDGEWHRYTKTFNFPNDRYGEVRLGLDSRQANVASNIPLEFTKWKLEEGALATPYTKAPESYTVVTRDDYYNHVKLMDDFKDSQFNQLKKAVIALGGVL